MITVDDITITDFKNYFIRDFDYAVKVGQTESIYDCQKDYVMDADITKAFNESKMCFNGNLFSTDTELTVAYLYLVAHYLANDLATSKQGIGSSTNYPVSSRSIGGISESYTVPEWISKSAIYSFLSTTRYGMKYISLLRPRLIGNVQVYKGHTTPW